MTEQTWPPVPLDGNFHHCPSICLSLRGKVVLSSQFSSFWALEIQRAIRGHSKNTLIALRVQESNQTLSYRRSLKYFVLFVLFYLRFLRTWCNNPTSPCCLSCRICSIPSLLQCVHLSAAIWVMSKLIFSEKTLWSLPSWRVFCLRTYISLSSMMKSCGCLMPATY